MSIPKSYREQVAKSCTNCKHSFMMYDYDESPSYYCHKDKTKRPLCGSVEMGESHFPDKYDKWYFSVFRRRKPACDKDGISIFIAVSDPDPKLGMIMIEENLN